MPRVVYTAPSAEPVSTADAKTHLRVTASTDDTYIDTLVKAARIYVEAQTRTALITQTWEDYRTEFPVGDIVLTPGPLASVTHIKYLDSDGTEQTLSTDVYAVNTKDCVGRCELKYNQSWPTTRTGHYNSVTIRYISGYGAAGSSVPANIIHAIKILVSHWYEVREPIIIGASVANVPICVDALLASHSVPEIF